MALINGRSVTLHKKTIGSADPFGKATYTTEEIIVDDVLCCPVSTQDFVELLNTTGKKIVYHLCIPKSDENDWTDVDVTIGDVRYHTVGIPKVYMTENIHPSIRWNKQIDVERYE